MIFKQIIKSILAGICIGIGGLAYLSIPDKIVGSLFFTIGLFTILTLDLNLFTGKLCYVIEKKNYIEVLVTLMGNFVGTLLISTIVQFTRLDALLQKADTIVNIKLNDNLLSLFLLAILCNMLIYIAVEGFKNFEGFNKILALFFGVSVFVICGFEHSVADMFYFTLVKCFNWQMLLRLSIIIAGNIIGGLGMRLLHNYIKGNKNEKV